MFSLGCTRTVYKMPILLYRDTKVGPELVPLVNANRSLFDAPYTFVIMVDRKACSMNLTESEYWLDWERFMHERGLGFVFVTSKQDSADVVTAIRLDGADAPVIVLPGSDSTISQLWAPGQSIPFKILVDSSASVYGYWLSTLDSSMSEKLLHEVDSVVTNKTPPFAPNGIVAK